MDHHNISLITTLASGFGLALVLGFLAARVKLPPLVGYLLAGILVGPFTPGFVADGHIAAQLSEIGVMLLMFGVGLHFSLDDLMSVRKIALPGAIVQMSLATLLGIALTMGLWGWAFGPALVFGLCLSCASTVVLLKALEAADATETMNGRIAIGWLVVEDLVTVLVLVLLPPLAHILNADGAAQTATHAPPQNLWISIATTLLSVGAFIALMLLVGRKVMPWILWQVAKTGSRELFTLSVIAAAISIAWGASELFSVSFALGAFFAGMVMRESKFSHRAAEESLPLRDAFSVLFFVSVGMLFDPMVLLNKPIEVLAVVAIIIAGKGLAAAALVLAFRYPLNTALMVAASLAQIGEFSFILGGLGVSLGLLPQEGMNLILAGALISIATNPFIFNAMKPIGAWALKHSKTVRRMEERVEPLAELPTATEDRYLKGQVILVGYGRVGKRIAEALDTQGIAYVVVDQNRERIEDLRNNGKAAVYGNAAEPVVLAQAHVLNAAMLVIATPDLLHVRQMVDTARRVNPDIEVVLRTHSEGEVQFLRSEKLGAVFFGEEELAKGMTRHILERFTPAPAAA
ncbi:MULTISPECIES: YbaL family putative K(+) efflux transporter [Asticcacaulis]|uniref:YbaL family putative K(+) efflux transporter n=1 Tax=Asticcacaulis TaxID=76890 RepID=UPI001AE83E97|nr:MULTISPECIES: YbaL family putative K(+) efflux transporter [Asticcacaulis]MBP2160228.1 CPA2 family monovalent cation:H+ antiporter-2 [Asticcacaulis solisilvae]MDR6801273.1 CPA2 family monovalent cation:H+ antiporter-2 [Asticcacaulis sp. BE141]